MRSLKMIDELKSEEIINKVGGKFKLTALVQRRLAELMQGGRPLIKDTEGKTMLEIVIQEILQDKITIDDGVSPGSAENRDKE
ncbi:MAG: DNA-directed RNA polymerase subunit omega [Planctomycetota bacterium]